MTYQGTSLEVYSASHTGGCGHSNTQILGSISIDTKQWTRESTLGMYWNTSQILSTLFGHMKKILVADKLKKTQKIYIFWYLSIPTCFPKHTFKHFPVSHLGSKMLTFPCRISFSSPETEQFVHNHLKLYSKTFGKFPWTRVEWSPRMVEI